MGQSIDGTSILWMYFECVVDKAPIVRPWNPPWKERIASFGDPGAWLIMQLDFSSSVNDTFSPRCTLRYHKNMALKAFSTLQEPHIIVVTQGIPFGATDISTSRNWFGHSLPVLVRRKIWFLWWKFVAQRVYLERHRELAYSPKFSSCSRSWRHSASLDGCSPAACCWSECKCLKGMFLLVTFIKTSFTVAYLTADCHRRRTSSSRCFCHNHQTAEPS